LAPLESDSLSLLCDTLMQMRLKISTQSRYFALTFALRIRKAGAYAFYAQRASSLNRSNNDKKGKVESIPGSIRKSLPPVRSLRMIYQKASSADLLHPIRPITLREWTRKSGKDDAE